MKNFFMDFKNILYSFDSPDKSDQAGDALLCPRDPRARDWSAVTRASSEYSWTPHLSHDMSSHITLTGDILLSSQLIVCCQPHYPTNHSRTLNIYHQNMDSRRGINIHFVWDYYYLTLFI